QARARSSEGTSGHTSSLLSTAYPLLLPEDAADGATDLVPRFGVPRRIHTRKEVDALAAPERCNLARCTLPRHEAGEGKAHRWLVVDAQLLGGSGLAPRGTAVRGAAQKGGEPSRFWEIGEGYLERGGLVGGQELVADKKP